MMSYRQIFLLPLFVLSTSIAADPVVNAQGILVGAAGIEVNGVLYDAEFVDGTCVDLFTGCDEDSDFPFNEETAFLAQELLLADVIQDIPNVGDFSSNPALTTGCTTGNGACQIFLPTRIRDDRDENDNDDIAIAGIANNASTGSDFVFGSASFSTFDTAPFQFVYVRWSPATTEPPVDPENQSMLLKPIILRSLTDDEE